MGAVIGRPHAFGAFWWDFVLGGDWRLAAGVVASLVLAAVLAHNGVPAWWVVPVLVLVVLSVSVVGLARGQRRE